MNKELIIHVGYPKTATTTFQENLIYKLSNLDKINLLIASNEVIKNFKLNNSILINYIYHYIIYNKWHDNIKNELDKIEEKKNKFKFIFSNETLSIFSEQDKINRNRVILSNTIFNNPKRIKKIFKNSFNKIKIVIIIRCQQKFVESIYKEWFPYISKTTDIKKFEDFAKIYTKPKNVRCGYLNYYKVIVNYQKVFGKKNVKILFYEDLIYNKNNFISNLSNILKIKKNLIFKAFNKKLNFKNNYEYKVSLNFFISKFVTPIFKVLLNDKIFEIIKNKYNHYFFPILEKYYIIK